ncbi:GAF and ANTAR domain-containing protein [Nocardioides sp.]|uniref:GAF and ANTAR domain-containing protein n=1 Tax=Nocardioides sp. TaxID=35761 RepID=UPI0027323A62|nr:GAF and ANTAR domain-containing protein [Nocardioides sp.]MDP3894799.1 GAF and ANTAR domain-containing protein [Nocardioides sp.]
MPSPEMFNRALADAAREMQAEGSTQEAMEAAVEIATKIISGCDMAGVSIIRSDGVDTPATSHPQLREADEYQFKLSEGPCYDTLDEHDTVTSSDLSTDSRWPRWGPQLADELGLFSVLSYRLFSEGGTIGALNLYGAGRAAFSSEDVYDGWALAAHIAVALAAAQEIEHLEKAVGSRTVIGQATGIVMERYDLDADEAFRVLARLSSEQNVKLRVLAQQVVQTRRLPTSRRPAST